MKYLLGALVFLVISDGVITEFLVTSGMGREWNKLLEPMIGHPSFLAVKTAGALICAALLWRIFRESPRLAVTGTSVFLLVYAGIVTWNLTVLFSY
ncbi:MAG: hypothetical protein IBX68_11470 [Dehalococcoidia bacterium]|nr:hypothetical protein [Dehalococcoidia bacterium]